MQPSSSLAAVAGSLVLAATAIPQEHYWIANRTSADVMRISSCGTVAQTVPLGTSLRSAHVAPDGKIWVVQFIQTTFTILNPDGTVHATPTTTLGSAFDIAFDKNGHGWVSGGTGVEEFDANGASVNLFPLTTGAPLGITVDADGNKWVAHRVGPPGTLSRIDATTGAITTHPLPGNSLILPVRCYADARGIGNPSHIWVTGDNRGAGELVEFDSAGNALNVYVIDPGGNINAVVADIDLMTGSANDVWLGDFRNGNVYQVDSTNGNILNAFLVGTDSIGIDIDGFQNLWSTSRGTTQVIRLDRATGTLEVLTTVGAGVQSSLSTGWQYATTVDPLGDLDRDSVPNLIEAMNESSPFDGCSTPGASLSVEGATSIGSTMAIRVIANAGAPTFIAFAPGAAKPGLRIPGFLCAFELRNPLPFSVGVTGPASLTIAIPNDPALVGLQLFAQGINVGAGTFTNVVCVNVF